MFNRSHLIRIVAPLIILIFTIFVFISNYQPETWLIGWDNIMPEFNLGLNLKRALFSVWQEYRGLGLYDGMAHAANLMHTIYIWALVFLLPLNMVRYVFIFLTYAAGGLGMYVFLKKILSSKNTTDHEVDPKKNTLALTTSLLGAFMYMVNPAVIQLYFAPLEVFAVHFMALPWMLYTIALTLYSPSRKKYLLLFLLSFLFSPQGFVPTIFITFMIAVGIFCIHFILHKSGKETLSIRIKRAIAVLSIIVASQVFWLLPYVYGLPHTSSIIRHTRINEFSSDTLFARNKAHGDLYSVLTMKGFMLDTIEKDTKSGENLFFMKVWKDHYESLPVSLLIYILIGIGFIGLIAALKQGNRHILPIAGIYGIALVFLAQNTPIFSQINSVIRMISPSFAEAFRIPFTKFATIYAFSFSVLFAYGAMMLMEKMKLVIRLGLIIGLFLFITAYPIFKGQFFSPLLRVKLPIEYLKLFSYMNSQPDNGRIALLPAQSFWNWQYRDWGHRGSGFLWYGIKQPILERAFDPWSLENEQFYNELSYAVSSENLSNFESVLKKYNISYVLLDETVMNSSSSKPINYPRLENFILQSEKVQKKVKFGSLKLYTIATAESPLSVIPKENVQPSSPYHPFMKHDILFSEQGRYTHTHTEPQITYPFAGLFTEKLPTDNTFTFSHENETLDITTEKLIPQLKKTQTYDLTIPSLFSYEYLIPTQISIENESLVIRIIYPEFFIDNHRYIIEGEIFAFPLSTVKNPTQVKIADSDQDITSPGLAYIQNKFNNIIIVNDGNTQETIQFDTRNITAEPFILSLPLSQLDAFTGRISTFDSPYTHTGLISKKMYEIKQELTDSEKEPTCGGNSRIIIDNQSNEYVDLQVKCDTGEIATYIDKMPHQAGYAMIVDAKYISGEPLTFYIDNPSEKRSEFETRLSKKSDKTIALLYPTQNFFNGYGLHFVAQSASTDISKTHLKNLSVYPFPIETFRRVSLGLKNNKNPQIEEGISPGSGSYTYKKHSIDKYTFRSDTDGYLMFDQAFNTGWHAYYVNSFNSFSLKFPFLFGKKINTHERTNGWMNGWIIEKNKNIVVIFLPQYLEFLGLVIIIGIPIIILRARL